MVIVKVKIAKVCNKFTHCCCIIIDYGWKVHPGDKVCQIQTHDCQLSRSQIGQNTVINNLASYGLNMIPPPESSVFVFFMSINDWISCTVRIHLYLPIMGYYH